jgi:hypothetical protein
MVLYGWVYVRYSLLNSMCHRVQADSKKGLLVCAELCYFLMGRQMAPGAGGARHGLDYAYSGALTGLFGTVHFVSRTVLVDTP